MLKTHRKLSTAWMKTSTPLTASYKVQGCVTLASLSLTSHVTLFFHCSVRRDFGVFFKCYKLSPTMEIMKPLSWLPIRLYLTGPFLFIQVSLQMYFPWGNFLWPASGKKLAPLQLSVPLPALVSSWYFHYQKLSFIHLCIFHSHLLFYSHYTARWMRARLLYVFFTYIAPANRPVPGTW